VSEYLKYIVALARMQLDFVAASDGKTGARSAKASTGLANAIKLAQIA
jgi:hypothetical protein